jgi:glutathione S-transferase
MPKNIPDVHAPYTLYKMDVSYFSGKIEAYLKYKSIPHVAVETGIKAMEDICKHTGTKKVPGIKTQDNKWLFDTTPMMQWFETQYPASPILSDDPALRFLMLLIEDYGDEWLWRPAMWWRWMPKISAKAVGNTIGKAMLDKWTGKWLGKYLAPLLGTYFSHRQKQEWLWDDGMTKANSHDVRDIMHREFDLLEAVFSQQPYLFGQQPSAADFGYFASMFRHFGNDPVPAEVMRRKAPHTYEWLARLWNVKANALTPSEWVWPEGGHWEPLFARISGDYLPYLKQNADAHEQGKKRFDFSGKGFQFNKTKTTQYRVYCLNVLQQEYSNLSGPDKTRVLSMFNDPKVVTILTADKIDSGLEDNFKLPKASINFKSSLKVLLMGQARN